MTSFQFEMLRVNMSGYDTPQQEADVERPEQQPGSSYLCEPQYYVPSYQLERYMGDEYKVNNIETPDVEFVSPEMQQKMYNLLVLSLHKC